MNKKIIDNYSFSPLNHDIYPDLVPLYKNSFKVNRDLNFIAKKFDNPYSAKNNFGYLSYDQEGNPSAFYGAFPYLLNINGNLVISSQSGDTMTHPSHSGKGLFLKTASLTYNLLKDNSIFSVYGFPSQSSFKGFIKLGWKFEYRIQRIRLFTPTLPLFILSTRYDIFEKFHKALFVCLMRFLKKGKTFPGQLALTGYDHVVHDDQFWRYKLANNDIIIVNIDDIDCVLKISSGKIIIGDFDCNKKKLPLKFQIILRMISFLSFSPVIDYYASPKNPNLKKFMTISSPVDALPYGWLSFNNSIDLSQLQFTALDFDTF